jgi:hypothetical protein
MAIEWAFPGEDTPGYLRRRREIMSVMNLPGTAEGVDAIIEMLLPYVLKPEDRDKARDALLDMTVVELGKVTTQLLGYQVGQVQDPKGGSSDEQ